MENKKIMSDQAITIGAILHNLMFQTDKSEPKAKIPRKAIIRSVKTTLATRRSVEYEKFNELVYGSAPIMGEARNNMLLGGKLLDPFMSPDIFLKFLKFRYPHIFNELGVKESDIHRYSAEISENVPVMATIVFVNRIFDAMDKYGISA